MWSAVVNIDFQEVRELLDLPRSAGRDACQQAFAKRLSKIYPDLSRRECQDAVRDATFIWEEPKPSRSSRPSQGEFDFKAEAQKLVRRLVSDPF